MPGGIARLVAVTRATLTEERLRGRRPSRDREELAFLPAVLEVVESPPSPLGRGLLWVVVGMLTLALVWAYIGQMDVVAVAHGKIVTTGRSKVVQPSETGVVRAIHVADGQVVKAGDILIELDLASAAADRERSRADLAIAQVESARLRAMLAERPERAFVAPPGVDPVTVETQQALMVSQVGEQRARLAALEHDVARKRADEAATRANIVKLERTLPLVRERADARMQLADRGNFSRLSALEQRQTAIEQEQDLVALRHRREEIASNIGSLIRQREQIDAEFRKNILLQLSEVEKRIVSITQDLLRAEQRSGLQTLTAPIDGVVQQLAVYTIGGVVTPAQQLLVVAPQNDALEVEAMVLNRDIGFIEAGQDVTIKLETFLFTKYGTIDGTVNFVSHDAVTDEKVGLVYPARITLNRTVIDIGGRRTPLGAGMAVTVEIKTDSRRMIEYLLSPMLRYQQESLRER